MFWVQEIKFQKNINLTLCHHVLISQCTNFLPCTKVHYKFYIIIKLKPIVSLKDCLMQESIESSPVGSWEQPSVPVSVMLTIHKGAVSEARRKVKVCLSVVSDSATPWTVARQSPLSMGFSRQEYWSGLPWPPPGDLPDPGIEPWSPVLQADSLPDSEPW